MRTQLLAAAVITGAVSLTAVGVGHAETATVTVSGDTFTGDAPGWLFNRDPGNVTPFEFTNIESSIGIGSLFVAPIGTNAPDKFIGELFLGADVGEVGDVSIDYQLADGVEEAKSNQFYWNVYVNFPESPADKFYDCRFDYVASGGSDTGFSPLVFGPDVAPTNVVKRNTSPSDCPATLGGMPDDAVLRVAAINIGDTSANDEGVGGYLDNVIVDIGAHTTTYDFEPAPVTKNDCKKGGFADFGYKNQGQCVASVVASPRANK